MRLNQAQNCLFSAQNECSAVSAILWIDRRRGRAGSGAMGTCPCSSSFSLELISEPSEGALQEGHPSTKACWQLSVKGYDLSWGCKESSQTTIPVPVPPCPSCTWRCHRTPQGLMPCWGSGPTSHTHARLQAHKTPRDHMAQVPS